MNAPSIQGGAGAEIRDVPPGGVWAKLDKPCSNENCEYREGALVLLAHPGTVRVLARVMAPGPWTLVRYVSARAASGAEAPDGAEAWVSPQQAARLPAPRPGDAR